ncbi:hypothetical protein BJY01DRAFT_231127 [Aspergillus pseudoustus]|uniref:Uncharacterized protein n=1 Tax=Aspergillus pseudoustus TaxID=1810923 RepID=A0ABR4KXT2_9EURO
MLSSILILSIPAATKACSEETALGHRVNGTLPLNDPSLSALSREPFKHKIKTLVPSLDGSGHFAHRSGKFYNKVNDIIGPNSNQKCSIHHWAERGIAGRGVLLNYHEYAKKKKIYFNPYETCRNSFKDLGNCGKEHGIDIRPESAGGDTRIGDILFIRSGWREAYNNRSEETQILDSANKEHPTFGGLGQEQATFDWLHDCYFAAVAGDYPSFEAWPASESYHHLHEYILSLWGMPLGEMLCLDKLAQKCCELKRWTLFSTSAPANCLNGVGSHVNGLAML